MRFSGEAAGELVAGNLQGAGFLSKGSLLKAFKYRLFFNARAQKSAPGCSCHFFAFGSFLDDFPDFRTGIRVFFCLSGLTARRWVFICLI
ncbi:MAG: hypothetical protein KBC60_11725 [Haliscomenobacter sp.]|nr:hypothetical protein [Haliscomenobacter sp.]